MPAEQDRAPVAWEVGNPSLFLPVNSCEFDIAARTGTHGSPTTPVYRRDGRTATIFCSTLTAKIECRAEDDHKALEKAAQHGTLRICIGDEQETGLDAWSANSVRITARLTDGEVAGRTSVTGLPPVFSSRINGGGVRLSTPALPSDVHHHPSAPDLDGVADTLRWGHPIDGHTLFLGIQLLGSGSEFSIGQSGVYVTPEWVLMPEPHEGSMPEQDRIDAQVQAFLRAASRLPSSGTFLSLSGGIDSRVALIALLAAGKSVPCVTLSPSSDSFEAANARAVCDEYSLEHHVIRLGSDYFRKLPDLVERAASLTGGTAAMAQSVDVFLYESLGRRYSSRISGMFGNQVGRGAVESTAVNTPDPSVLSDDLVVALRSRSPTPWYSDRVQVEELGPVLMQQECCFPQLANYVVGSAFVRQLTPYADLELMRLAGPSLRQMWRWGGTDQFAFRSRDAMHRWAGPPRRRSFQRKLLSEVGREVRHVPLNFGWLASGGWAPRASLQSARAVLRFVFAEACARFQTRRLASRIVSGNRKPWELVDWPRVFRTHLREMVCDTLLASSFLESNVVRPAPLSKLVDAHFSERTEAFNTLWPLFEVALSVSRWSPDKYVDVGSPGVGAPISAPGTPLPRFSLIERRSSF